MSSVSVPPSGREASAPDRPAVAADAAGRPAKPSDLPSVERLLASRDGQAAVAQFGHARVTGALRRELALLRRDVLAGTLSCSPADLAVVARARARIQEEDHPRLRPVFNLTGTVLHTNLGRALLPDAAVQAVVSALLHPMNLEYDLESGKRGDRDDLIEDLLCELTGAEAATVVNNNAAAVLLMLSALADRREVVVSRGELVEIGGAFRIPDIMKRAGAKLIEIGTTNRTHPSDYEAAIGPRTALLMKVHCSNYAVNGFTKSVDIAQVTSIAHAAGLPSAVDLGSGTLVDLAQWGLPREETVEDNIKAGADVVTFSGDKLLGGPQAGLIVGRADLVRRIKKNPLKRALRVGKLTLAALEPVLQLYRSPELLSERLTTLRLLTRSREQIRQQAERVLPAVRAALGERYEVSAEPMMSQIGSGALPVDRLPSYGLAIRRCGGGRSGTALRQAEARLRNLQRPVIGRIGQDTLWLDLRCLEHDGEAIFLAQLAAEPDAVAPKERA